MEQLAGELWESRRDREIDPPWADCGSYWQPIFLGFARTALDMLASNHRRLVA